MTVNINNQYNNYEKQIADMDTTGVLPLTKGANSGSKDTIPPVGNSNTSVSDTPTISTPIYDMDLSAFDGAIPASLGACALAAIQELANEERQTASTVSFQNSMSIADKMETQADNTEHNATVQLALSLTASALQIGASCATIGMSTSALSKSASGQLGDGALMLKNTQIQGVSGAINGCASMFTAGANFHNSMTEAENKRIDAEIERMRANNTQLDSLQDSMKELIRSARQNQDAIQQSTNQARTKVLC